MKKNKKVLSILSWTTHGAYVLVCTMAILLMKFPIPELPGWLNDVRVLFLMLTLGFSILFSVFCPFALFGLGFNISLLKPTFVKASSISGCDGGICPRLR